MNNLMQNPNNSNYNFENNSERNNNYSLRKSSQRIYGNSNQNSYIYNNNPEMDIQQPDTNTSINILNEKEIASLKNLLNQEKEKNLLIQKELHNLKNYCVRVKINVLKLT